MPRRHQGNNLPHPGGKYKPLRNSQKSQKVPGTELSEDLLRCLVPSADHHLHAYLQKIEPGIQFSKECLPRAQS